MSEYDGTIHDYTRKGGVGGLCQRRVGARRPQPQNRSDKSAFAAVKDAVKEAEQIHKSIYSILRQEQRERQPHKTQEKEL